jgi:sec-independent protein translocase protein TatA
MIPGMASVGGGELLIILLIVLLLFGAKRVPELGRSLGKSIQECRSGFSK